MTPILRKLTRDSITSLCDDGELVGVYFADTDGSKVLIECSPHNADLIIDHWNDVVDDESEPYQDAPD